MVAVKLLNGVLTARKKYARVCACACVFVCVCVRRRAFAFGLRSSLHCRPGVVCCRRARADMFVLVWVPLFSHQGTARCSAERATHEHAHAKSRQASVHW